LYKLNHAATVGLCWIVLREVLGRGDTRQDVPVAILAAQYHCRVRLSQLEARERQLPTRSL